MSHYLTMIGIGRATAYYANLAIYLESVTAAVFLAQIIYWHDKTDNPMGVYKTSDEIRQETGLSYREQATARKKLVELGLIVETHKRLEHKIYFRFVPDAFDAWLDSFIENSETTKAQSPNCVKRISPNDENAFREVRKTHFVYTESTAESTAKNTTRNKHEIANNQALEIFEHWKTVFEKPNTLLTPKRKAKIVARLGERYTVEQIKTAIDHNSKSDFHIKNNHHDIELICRSAEKMDYFLGLKPEQPKDAPFHDSGEPFDRSKYVAVKPKWAQ